MRKLQKSALTSKDTTVSFARHLLPLLLHLGLSCCRLLQLLNSFLVPVAVDVAPAAEETITSPAAGGALPCLARLLAADELNELVFLDCVHEIGLYCIRRMQKKVWRKKLNQELKGGISERMAADSKELIDERRKQLSLLVKEHQLETKHGLSRGRLTPESEYDTSSAAEYEEA